MPADGTRKAWTLIGLATRIAISLGLHRDGSNFPCFSAFEIEMHRRLWWHICVLDVRASEDTGTAITSLIHADTAFPGNFNDSDLDLDMNIPPAIRTGATEMSYSLLSFDAFKVFGEIGPTANITLEEKERIIDGFSTHIEMNYLRHFTSNQSSPISRLFSIIGQVLISKMKIQIYFSALRRQSPAKSSSKLVDDVFSSAISILELQARVTSSEDLKGFRWLLGSYRQMHAMAFVLSQLSIRIDALKGTSVDGFLPHSEQRAWSAVNGVFREYDCSERSRPSWGPLLSLKQKIELKIEGENGVEVQGGACSSPWMGWDAGTLDDFDFLTNAGTW
jgi:hypothetical protein